MKSRIYMYIKGDTAESDIYTFVELLSPCPTFDEFFSANELLTQPLRGWLRRKVHMGETRKQLYLESCPTIARTRIHTNAH